VSVWVFPTSAVQQPSGVRRCQCRHLAIVEEYTLLRDQLWFDLAMSPGTAPPSTSDFMARLFAVPETL
jgi:hypothetical protein